MSFQTNESYEIYHDLIINASLTKVFEAITKPNHLIKWWPLKCVGKPEIGGEYNFYFTPEYDWFGEVIEYLHNKAFYIKMIKSNSDWNSTTFGFDIDEINGNVQLKFWHIGWQRCNADYRRSSFCWAILLNGLKNYIEKGIVIPFKERE
mgnify:FL=1|jgi:uncharacterized protein YndB with AHSA1/START domain